MLFFELIEFVSVFFRKPAGDFGKFFFLDMMIHWIFLKYGNGLVV